MQASKQHHRLFYFDLVSLGVIGLSLIGMWAIFQWVQFRRRRRNRQEQQLRAEKDAAETKRRMVESTITPAEDQGRNQLETRNVEHAAEDERRIQRETRDCEHAQALHLTLCDLRRHMDPSIATQVYNNCFCPLTQLPEELLLHIITFVDDHVTLHCLRIASRTLLRLVDTVIPPTRAPLWSENLETYKQKLRFRSLLQRDGRCSECKRWNDANPCFGYDPCKFTQLRAAVDHGSTYCNACDAHHDACQFSLADQQPSPHPRLRRCLGQLGLVQLCEHIHISWASIGEYIEVWRQRHPKGGAGDSRADEDLDEFLDKFHVECRDVSHDTRCTNTAATTWPRANLRISADRLRVSLNLQWTPHCRVDALHPRADGRIPAPELRKLFRRLRLLGPADLLCPGVRYPDALPEMVCFQRSPTLKRCVYYETGEDDENPPAESPMSMNPSPSLPMDCSLPGSTLFSRHGTGCLHDHHGLGCNGRRVIVARNNWDRESPTALDCWCLAVRYEKDITICKVADMIDSAIKLVPSHPWLHAMDIRTYPHPQATPKDPLQAASGPGFWIGFAWSEMASKYPRWRVVRPLCKNESCCNYYLGMERQCEGSLVK